MNHGNFPFVGDFPTLLGVEVISDPQVNFEPISRAEAKNFIRVTALDQDTVIDSLIARARGYIEEIADIRITNAQLRAGYLRFPNDSDNQRALIIPRPPLTSIVSISFLDETLTEIQVDAADYFVDTLSTPGRVVLADGKIWPDPSDRMISNVRVIFNAGFATPALVPERIKHALFLLISHWYEHREAVIDEPVPKTLELGVMALVNSFKNHYAVA